MLKRKGKPVHVSTVELKPIKLGDDTPKTPQPKNTKALWFISVILWTIVLIALIYWR